MPTAGPRRPPSTSAATRARAGRPAATDGLAGTPRGGRDRPALRGYLVRIGAVGAHDPPLEPGVRPAGTVALEHDLRAVRREGGAVGGGTVRGQDRVRVAPRGRDDVDLPLLVGHAAGERDRRAVGRPRRVVVRLAVREGARLAG